MKVSINRRSFFSQSLYKVSILSGGALWISGCGSKTEEKKTEEKKPEEKPVSKDPCNDFSKVSENDLNARKKLGYVNASPIPESKCGNCQLFLPPKPGIDCGNCQLFKGPVMTAGYCTYWAPQVEG